MPSGRVNFKYSYFSPRFTERNAFYIDLGATSKLSRRACIARFPLISKMFTAWALLQEVIRWLTGYSQDDLEAHLSQGTDFEGFFSQAPAMHPRRDLVTGVACGVRVEMVKDPSRTP